ncbi:class II aldolase/adducin family protein [Desulfotruncus alcoholivorax]|uniref:class II aldolase/adducin family protein n=1 Tax=Desulfotruncus alcoholivorax TaxID=265477 RepID=UPI000408F1AD|nr:class II aldolase/adducin family protein [Desulfotruncus alcoholivorax]
MTVAVEKSKEMVLKAGSRMACAGLVTGTWGNISARVPGENLYVITPSGISCDRLSKSDLVIVESGGRVIEGERKPSTELKLHLAIYNAREDVTAIMHTHSTFASAMAVAGQTLPPILEDLAQLVGGKVPVTRYARAGTPNLAAAVLEVLGQSNAVLLANHGVVGMGRNLEEAFQVCMVVEKAAQVYAWASLLGKVNEIPKEEALLLRDLYITSYGQSKNSQPARS